MLHRRTEPPIQQTQQTRYEGGKEGLQQLGTQRMRSHETANQAPLLKDCIDCGENSSSSNDNQGE